MRFSRIEIDILDDALLYWSEKANLDKKEKELLEELRQKIRANQ